MAVGYVEYWNAGIRSDGEDGEDDREEDVDTEDHVDADREEPHVNREEPGEDSSEEHSEDDNCRLGSITSVTGWLKSGGQPSDGKEGTSF